MTLPTVVLAGFVVGSVAFALICLRTVEVWRARCLVAEWQRDQLWRERDELRCRLDAYDRIAAIGAVTRCALRHAIR